MLLPEPMPPVVSPQAPTNSPSGTLTGSPQSVLPNSTLGPACAFSPRRRSAAMHRDASSGSFSNPSKYSRVCRRRCLPRTLSRIQSVIMLHLRSAA